MVFFLRFFLLGPSRRAWPPLPLRPRELEPVLLPPLRRVWEGLDALPLVNKVLNQASKRATTDLRCGAGMDGLMPDTAASGRAGGMMGALRLSS